MPDNTTPVQTKEEIVKQEYEKKFGAQKYDKSVNRQWMNTPNRQV